VRHCPTCQSTVWAFAAKGSTRVAGAGQNQNQIYSLEQYTVIPIAIYSFVPPDCHRGWLVAGRVWPPVTLTCLLVATGPRVVVTATSHHSVAPPS
jgi:hypothetical protein